MDIVLARRTDYAIRAVLDLARHEGALRKAREISGAMEISPNYLARILATLVSSGILHATAGPAGGYRLARPPARISLLDVVEIFEGHVEVRQCILRSVVCSTRGTCDVHHAWVGAQAAMTERLASTTFHELVDDARRRARPA